MNDVVGITKEIDRLGRIVVTKELQERFGLTDSVEIIPTANGILLRSPEYKLTKIKGGMRSEKIQ